MGHRNAILSVAVAVLVADQLSKWAVVRSLGLNGRFPLLDGYLSLTYVRNRGAAFGLLADVPSPLLRWGLVTVSLVALLLIWSYAREGNHQGWVGAAFGAILGGAAGNLVDRLRLGYVVDFMDVHWRGYHWPAFNVADAAITIGAISLFIALSRNGSEEAPAPAEADDRGETLSVAPPERATDRSTEGV